jgi:hypothetical protein
MKKFHNNDDAFIAIGGPAHGQLLQHYGDEHYQGQTTHLFIAPPPLRIDKAVSIAELLKPIRYDTYELREVAWGPRRMKYFVHAELSREEALRLIIEFEREDEEPEVGRR